MIKKINGDWEVNDNVTVKHPVTDCVNGGLCSFPFCEHHLECENRKDPVEHDKVMEVKTKGSVKQYFTYQEDLNKLKNKISKIEDAQKEIYKNIKTDVTSIFIAHDYNDMDFKVELTPEGIKIELYVKVYNDYQIIHPINTSLFNHLDELMGISGKMNICDRRKIDGNQVYTLELTYEL